MNVNMDMSDYTGQFGILFNLVMGALCFLGGWLFTRVFSLFDKQETLMKEINDKTFHDFISLRKEMELEGRKHQQEIADLALKVSVTYMTKESFETYFNRIEDKLDRNFEIIQKYLIGKN
jgi:hypothetical protein